MIGNNQSLIGDLALFVSTLQFIVHDAIFYLGKYVFFPFIILSLATF